MKRSDQIVAETAQEASRQIYVSKGSRLMGNRENARSEFSSACKADAVWLKVIALLQYEHKNDMLGAAQ